MWLMLTPEITVQSPIGGKSVRPGLFSLSSLAEVVDAKKGMLEDRTCILLTQQLRKGSNLHKKALKRIWYELSADLLAL